MKSNSSVMKRIDVLKSEVWNKAKKYYHGDEGIGWMWFKLAFSVSESEVLLRNYKKTLEKWILEEELDYEKSIN